MAKIFSGKNYNKNIKQVEINKALQDIVELVGSFFNTGACVISLYDNKDGIYRVTNQYKSAKGTASIVELNQNPKLWKKFIDYLSQNDTSIYADNDSDILHEAIKEKYVKLGIESSITAPIKQDGILIGSITIYEIKNKDKLKFDNLAFLRHVSHHVSYILYYLNILNFEKEKRIQEELLRTVLSYITSSLDIEFIKKNVVENIGKAFNADRCFIRLLPENSTQFNDIDDNSEYLMNKKVRSIKNLHIKHEHFKRIYETLYTKKPIIITNLKEYIKNNPKDILNKTLFYDYQCQSSYCLPIFHSGKLVGALLLQYTDKINVLKSDEMQILETLTNYVGIAIHQANQYKKSQLKSQREVLVRKITETIRSTLDINEIKSIIVEEVGKAFNADRCYFRPFDPIVYKYAKPKFEYLKSDKVKSIINIEPDNEGILYFLDQLNKNKNNFIIKDVPKFIEENNLKGSPLERYMAGIDVLSAYPFPIWITPNKPNYLVLHYTDNIVSLSDDEQETIALISKQIEVAIQHAKLYENSQKQAAKDKLSNKILNDIRQSLDIDLIQESIVNQIGQALNATRCYIVEYDNNTKLFSKIKYEYLKSSELKTNVDLDTYNITPEFVDIGHQGIEISVPDMDIFIKEHFLDTNSEEYLREFNVQSCLFTPIKYGDMLLGFLCIHYDEKNAFDKSDIEFVRAIVDHTSIAIHQANIHEHSTKQALKELILRKIVSAIKTHSNIEDIKNIVLDEINSYFMADRIFINLTYKNDLLIINLDEYSERLSSPDVKSFHLIDPYSQSMQFFKEWLMSKNGVLFNDHNRFLQEQGLQDHPVKDFFEEFGVSASLTVTIPFQDTILGVLGLNYCSPQSLTQEDYEFIQIIAENIGIAFNKVLLYEQLKVKAHKEEYLKNFVTKIRKSLNLDEVLSVFSKEIMHSFNVDNVLVVQTPDPLDGSNWINKKYVSADGAIFPKRDPQKAIQVGNFWKQTLSEHNYIYSIPDISDADIPDYIKDYYKQLGVRSILSVAIKDHKKIWGLLFISQCSNRRIWTKNEIELFEVIAEKGYDAISHAQMYEKLKKQLDKENLLRADDSLLINKHFAGCIGLCESITYSTLIENYNEKSLTKDIAQNEYIEINIEDIAKKTFLDKFNQKIAIEKLKDLGLIDIKKIDSQKISYAISKYADDIIKRFILKQKFECKDDILIDTNYDKKIYTMKELEAFYLKYFKQEIVDSVIFFIKKACSQKIENITASKPYFSMLCKTFNEFALMNAVKEEELKLIIESLFDFNLLKSEKKVINLTSSNTILVKKLKKILLYRIYESKLFTTDFNSKIDLSIPELSWEKDFKSLEQLLKDE